MMRQSKTKLLTRAMQGCALWLLCCCYFGTALSENCRDLEFVPGYNLGGEGFDVVTMERKTHSIINMEDAGDEDQCKSYVNIQMDPVDPELRQKVPLSVTDWKPRSKCYASVSSKTYQSSDEFQHVLSHQIQNDWTIEFSILSEFADLHIAGSQSRLAKFTQRESKSGQYSFNEVMLECKMYDYSLDPTLPPLSETFVDAVKTLPVLQDPENKTCSSYRRFIEDFGTHYLNKVTLGGRMRSVTAIHICQAHSYGLSVEDISKCLSLEAKINMGETYGKGGGEYERCQSKLAEMGYNSSFSSVFDKRVSEILGGDHDDMVNAIFDPKVRDKVIEWVESLSAQPEIIEYSIKPLYSVIRSMSGDVENAEQIATAMKHATEAYVEENADRSRLCSNVCAFKCRNNILPNDDCSCTCSVAEDTDQNCCPQKGYGFLKFTDLRVSGVKGDWFNKADPYLVTKEISPAFRTHHKSNTEDASWDEVWDFGPQRAGNTLTLELRDKDIFWDDSCGECEIKVQKMINPMISCQVSTKAGSGTIHFRMNFTCEAYYSGPWCNDFNESLQDRNAATFCSSSKQISWEEC